jgi:hypothetical protein
MRLLDRIGKPVLALSASSSKRRAVMRYVDGSMIRDNAMKWCGLCIQCRTVLRIVCHGVPLSLDEYFVVQEYFCNFVYYFLSAFLTEIQKVGRRGGGGSIFVR